MSKVRIGCLGGGQRGKTMTKTILNMCENVEIVAVCDLYEDRAINLGEMVKEKTGTTPVVTTNPDEVIAMENVDAVNVYLGVGGMLMGHASWLMGVINMIIRRREERSTSFLLFV